MSNDAVLCGQLGGRYIPQTRGCKQETLTRFGARKLQSDDPSERTDDRVVEVVVSADGAPFIIGQRVLVKFRKGSVALAQR